MVTPCQRKKEEIPDLVFLALRCIERDLGCSRPDFRLQENSDCRGRGRVAVWRLCKGTASHRAGQCQDLCCCSEGKVSQGGREGHLRAGFKTGWMGVSSKVKVVTSLQ